MLKNTVIAILIATTAAGAYFAYQNSQKIIAMTVLLEDKSKALTSLEAEKSDITHQAELLQAELDKLKAAEAEQQAKEAALNAAKVSDEDIKKYGEPCKDWIASNFGDDDYPDYTKSMASIEDSWMKDGLYVFEIAFPSRMGASTSTILLCIFDKEKQSMFKPSAYDMNNWRRNR